MSLEEVDVAVIGAGPSGLIAAREASLRGEKVLVLEEHREVGLPCHCAGLLSMRGLSEIGVPLDGEYVQNRFRGAHFFSPSNLSFTIERRKEIACVVNRYLLDNFLAEQALRNGSLIKLNSRVKAIRYRGGFWLLNVNGHGWLRARLLIDAEGALPKVLGMTGLKTLDTKDLLKGLQTEIKTVDIDPDFVEIHFSSKLAPGFFAWVIPINNEVARVGLACRNANPRDLLFKFMRKRFGNMDNRDLKYFDFRSGLVITCGPIEKTYSDGLLVVGDSAGQVKPITGGGVIFGGVCAKIAGRVASEAIKNDEIREDFLKNYEREWKAKLWREFKAALLARKILNRLSDRHIDKIFSVIIREEIDKALSREGDMDFQGTTILRVVKRRILKFLPTILRAILPF
ncbi:NAD(P)/FAD-dependent oxidoreductase [Candidatus Bathyarchaeota archaeon]|nr:NAD(P)/FAD-dependent oxidoreductase [Candidatus Bathyarchaeota archaeon]